MPSLRVLLVDDEPEIREILARALRREFPEGVVDQADDATGGLTLVRQNAYDLVVSDYRMPGDDGVTFLRKVRDASPTTIRILLTGYPDEGAALRAINDAHLERFLTKPIALSAFLDAVREAWLAKRAADARSVAFARGLTELRTELDKERSRHEGATGARSIPSPYRGGL